MYLKSLINTDQINFISITNYLDLVKMLKVPVYLLHYIFEPYLYWIFKISVLKYDY